MNQYFLYVFILTLSQVSGAPQEEEELIQDPFAECDEQFPSCRYTAGTTCMTGICTCTDSALKLYEGMYGQMECALPIGSPCSEDSASCPMFASCENPKDSTSAENRICSNGINRPCSSSSDCNSGEFLACLNNMCKCENPISHIERNGKCFVRTYSKGCSLTNNGSRPSCEDPNSECDLNEVCSCKPGSIFLPQYGICEVSPVGTSCKQQYDCGEGLECKNNLCQCIDESMIYDQVKRRCKVQLGERCDVTEYSSMTHQSDFCHTPEAKCSFDTKKKIHVCKCDESMGFYEETDMETGDTVCAPTSTTTT